MTMTPGVKRSRAFRRSALWLCSSCSHQWPTTYSGQTVDGVSRASPANVADVIEDRSDDLPVGRVDDFQLDGNLPCAPLVSERLCFWFVDLNGDRGQCAGVGGARKGEGLQGGQEAG